MHLKFKIWLLNELDGGLLKQTGIGAGSSVQAIKPTPIKSKQQSVSTTQKSAEEMKQDQIISDIQNAATLYQKDIQKSGGNVNIAATRDPQGTFNVLTKYNQNLAKNKDSAIAAIKGLLYGDAQK